MTLKTSLIAVCTTAFLIQAPRGMAQDAPPPPSAPAAPSATAAAPVNPGPGGGGANTDFRQRMNERMKAALQASDDEWAVIEPLLEKVETAQRATMAGRFGGFGGRRGGGGPGGPGGGGAPAVSGTNGGGGGGGRGPGRFDSPEADALRSALADSSTSPEDIKTKLQALRDARKKAAADLETARGDLQKVLTLRQEATLVEMGILD